MARSRAALLTLAALAAFAGSCVCAPQGSAQGGVQGGAQVPPGVPLSTSAPGVGSVRSDTGLYGVHKSYCLYLRTPPTPGTEVDSGTPGGTCAPPCTPPCALPWGAHTQLPVQDTQHLTSCQFGHLVRKAKTGNAKVYIVLALLIGFVAVVVGCWLSDNCWSPEPEDILAGG